MATILESRAWSAPWLKSKPESESGKMVGERMVQRSLKVAMASSGMRVKRKLESFQGTPTRMMQHCLRAADTVAT